jgi:hypothetical protein
MKAAALTRPDALIPRVARGTKLVSTFLGSAKFVSATARVF